MMSFSHQSSGRIRPEAAHLAAGVVFTPRTQPPSEQCPTAHACGYIGWTGQYCHVWVKVKAPYQILNIICPQCQNLRSGGGRTPPLPTWFECFYCMKRACDGCAYYKFSGHAPAEATIRAYDRRLNQVAYHARNEGHGRVVGIGGTPMVGLRIRLLAEMVLRY